MPSPLEPPRDRDDARARGEARDDIGALLLVLAVAAALVLLPLGQRVISTSHEARFAVLAQDMVNRGAWLEARVGGEVYRNKPPLFPWSIAVLSLAGGRVTEATAQAPATIAALATVGLTFLLGRALWGRRAGLWSGLILVTTYEFFAYSQLVLPDMLVVAFFTAAGWTFWRSVSAPPRPWALAGFYVALAFGVFAKGPVGLLPLLVAATWLWSEAGVRGLVRLWSPIGAVAFVLVTLGWLGPFLAHGTRSFAQRVLWQDWFDWFVGLPVPKQWLAFVMESALGLLPWGVLLPLALVSAVRAWRDRSTRFVLLWLLVPFVLVATSNNPRARYILVVYPAAALLLGWWADRQLATPSRLTRATGWSALAASAGVVVLLVWLRASPGASPGLAREAPIWAVSIVALMIAGTGAAMFGGLRARRPALFVGGVATSTAVMFAFGVWVYDGWVNRTHAYPRVVERLSHHAASQEPIAYLNRRFYQLDFYAGRELPQIRTVQAFNAWMALPERPVALVNGRNWTFIEPHRSPHLAVLERFPAGDEELLIVRDSRPRATEGTSSGR